MDLLSRHFYFDEGTGEQYWIQVLPVTGKGDT